MKKYKPARLQSFRPAFRSQLCPAAPGWSSRYRNMAAAASPLWRNWLLDNGSLTRRLQNLQAGTFSVHLCGHGYAQASPMECLDLGLRSGSAVWYREVELNVGDQKLVQARTVVPLHSGLARLSPLSRLGNRSLGSYLFRQPGLQRQTVRIHRCHSCVDSDASWRWARRSIFTLNGQRLQVTEVFDGQAPVFAKLRLPSHRIHAPARR